MTRPGNIFPKTGNFFPKNGNGHGTPAEQSKAAHRTHLTWSGKARDLPRFSQVYADTAAAIGLRQPQKVSTESNPSPSSVTGGRLPQSRPAADWGRG